MVSSVDQRNLAPQSWEENIPVSAPGMIARMGKGIALSELMVCMEDRSAVSTMVTRKR
jgi:hypothetical protein